MFSSPHALLCIQTQLLGTTSVRAPKCPMLRAGCARMPSWTPPWALSGWLPDLTVSIHTSSQLSLGCWMGYGEAQTVAEEIRGKKEWRTNLYIDQPPPCTTDLSQSISQEWGWDPKKRARVSNGETRKRRGR